MRSRNLFSSSVDILPTPGRTLLNFAAAVTDLAQQKLGFGLRLWRLVDLSTRGFENWTECPVVGPDGKPLYLDLRDGGFGVLTQGFGAVHFEPLMQRLARDAVVLDVGANIGVMARLFAQRVPEGKVYAFEPSPETFRLLTKNCAAYPNIVCVRQAIGATTGEAAFDEGVMPTLRHLVPAHEQGGTTVPVTRLDDWVTQAKLTRLDFIKIDIEGFEEELFDGAEQSLAKFLPVILVEYLPEVAAARSRYKGRVLFRRLREQGYRVYRLDSQGRMHEDFVNPEDWTNDYVAVPEHAGKSVS